MAHLALCTQNFFLAPNVFFRFGTMSEQLICVDIKALVIRAYVKCLQLSLSKHTPCLTNN